MSAGRVVSNAILLYVAYKVSSPENAPDDPVVVVPPPVTEPDPPSDNDDWLPIENGGYRMTALADIVTFGPSVEQIANTPYWVYDEPSDEYQLMIWAPRYSSGGAVLHTWVPCTVGKVIAVPSVGDAGKPGAAGPPGPSVARGLDLRIPTTTVNAPTTTFVPGVSFDFTVPADVEVTASVFVEGIITASTGQAVLQVMNGTTALAQTIDNALNSSSLLTGQLQQSLHTFVIPAASVSRVLSIKLVLKVGNVTWWGSVQ